MEQYSDRMTAALRTLLPGLPTADLLNLLEGLRYRHSLGVALVEEELRVREKRHPLNYPPQAA